MKSGQEAPPGGAGSGKDAASDGLADASLNQAPATPGGPPAQDEGRHKVPGNDQLKGLQKAEEAGKQPARPGPRP